MKVLVFGNSGSGKSTLAALLAQQHGLAHLDLDWIVWEPGRIAEQRLLTDVLASLSSFMDSHENWVIEGCYGELVESAAKSCSEMIFLNPGLEACLEHNLQRPWEPHKYKSKADQHSMLANLQAWVAGYYERSDDWSYQAHRKIFDSHAGTKQEITQAPRTAA